MHSQVLAEALLGFIDVDRNGRIEGGELKKLLTLMGFPMALLLPIPANLGMYIYVRMHTGPFVHTQVGEQARILEGAGWKVFVYEMCFISARQSPKVTGINIQVAHT